MPEASILFFCRILAVLLQFIEGWYFMKCIDCCLQRRSRLLSLTAGLTGYAAVSGIVIQPGDLVNITSALAAFILLNFLLYKGTWAVRLSLAVILLPVSSALNLLVFEMTGALYFQYFTAGDTLPNAVCSSLSCVFPTLFSISFTGVSTGLLKKCGKCLPHGHGALWPLSAQRPLPAYSAAFTWSRNRTPIISGPAWQHAL